MKDYEQRQAKKKIERKRKKKYDHYKEEYGKQRIKDQTSKRKRQRFVWVGVEDSDDE
jgi:hypothetical protein